MTDYCIKVATEADFDQLLLGTGLGVEENGAVVPANDLVLIDRIGSITVLDPSGKTDTEGNLLTITYPQYHGNIRLLFDPTEEQVTALSAYAISPDQPQYRVWA